MDTGDFIEVTTAGSWSFAGNTAQNFDAHVSKSVPLYLESHELIKKLSDFYIRNDCTILDIGCSTGTLLYEIGKRHSRIKSFSMIGVDPVKEMCEKASEKFDMLNSNAGISAEIYSQSLMDIEVPMCSFITCVYTMQFIHPSIRQSFIDKIYASLEWGGAFILFEKIRGEDARFQDIYTSLYNEYKLDSGYTAEQIVNKSLSLKGVLEPFSSLGVEGLLRRGGFEDISPIFQYLCFKGYLAIK